MESRAWGDLAHELTADGFGHPKRVSYNGNEATISRLAPNGICGLKQKARKWASRII
jgi:hypothetical protein